MTQPGDSLIAERVDTTSWYSGVGIAESIDMLIDGIESRSWVDGTLGAVTTVIEGAAWGFDPFGMLVTAGFGWVVEHVEQRRARRARRAAVLVPGSTGR